MKTVTREDIFNVVKEAELNLNEDISKMDPDELFLNQGLDSLDMASLLFALEDKFAVKISDESIANGDWRTLTKMVNSLNRLINA